MDTRRSPIAARLAATAATLALLVGCTTSSGDDADPDDPTTTAAAAAPTWKRQLLDGPTVARNRSSIDDGEFLADGTERAWLLAGAIDTLKTSKPVVWQSPDRTAWTRQDLPGDFTDMTNVELAVGDGERLAVGRDEAAGGPSAPVWQLQRGRWKTVDADLPENARITVAIRAAKAWFVLGSAQAEDGSTLDAVWRSVDAKSWKQVFTVPEGGDLKTLAGVTDVAVGGTLGTGDQRRSVIWHATKGSAWSKAIALPTVSFRSTTEERETTGAEVSSLAQGTSGWKAVGSAVDKGRIKPVTWTSSDGVTWQPEEVIPPYLESARSGSPRRAQRVVWDGGSFLAYGGSDRAHETWIYEPFSGYWVDAAIPSAFKQTEGRGGFTALVGDGEGNLLLAGESDRRIRVWANAVGGFDNEVTDAQLMPTDAAYSDIYDVQVRDDAVAVVGRFDDGGERPLLWTGTGVDKLTRATGSDALTGRVDVATVEDRHVVVWGSAKDNSLLAWKSPIAKPALATAPDVVTAIGATSTEAGVTSVHASFAIGGQAFVAGVDPQGPRAVPTVWAVQGETFTRQELQPEGDEAVQVFTGGCGGEQRGLAHGVAYGADASAQDRPIAAVIAKSGRPTFVDREQLQPEDTSATIITCAVVGGDLVLGGSLARGAKPARPTTWTSKDGERWKIDDDLGTVAEGRVFRLTGYGKGAAAIVVDRNDVSSVWRTGTGGDWVRSSTPGTFGGSTVYVNGLVTTPDGRLVVGGASRNQATLWTLPANAGG